MSVGVLVACAFAYLAALFALAHLADRRARQGRSLINNPIFLSCRFPNDVEP